VNPGQHAEARELANNEAFTWARASAIAPFVVAVDQAEDIDITTVAMLSTLARHGRGLIALAINTDGHSLHGPGAGRNIGLDTWLREEAAISSITTITLEPLTDTEMTDLALHHLKAANLTSFRIDGLRSL
jgi:hypothetical protein